MSETTMTTVYGTNSVQQQPAAQRVPSCVLQYTNCPLTRHSDEGIHQTSAPQNRNDDICQQNKKSNLYKVMLQSIKQAIDAYYDDLERFKRKISEYSAYLGPYPTGELLVLHEKCCNIRNSLQMLLRQSQTDIQKEEISRLYSDVAMRSLIVSNQSKRTIKHTPQRQTSFSINIAWLGMDGEAAEQLKLTAAVISLMNVNQLEGGKIRRHDEYAVSGVLPQLTLSIPSKIYEANMTSLKVLAKTKRAHESSTDKVKVTDCKYYIQFKAELMPNDFFYAYSHSIILMTAPSQDQNSRGTIFWDSAFPSPQRALAYQFIPYLREVEEEVSTPRVCQAVFKYFFYYTGREPDAVQQNFICQKFNNIKRESSRLKLQQISFKEFVHNPLIYSSKVNQVNDHPILKFSLWQWLDGCANLLRMDSIQNLWINGHFAGFINRAEAKQNLSKEEPGTFLVRFQEGKMEKNQKERPITFIAVEVVHDGGASKLVTSVSAHLSRENLEKPDGLCKVLTQMDCMGKRVNTRLLNHFTNVTSLYEGQICTKNLTDDNNYICESDTYSVLLPQNRSDQCVSPSPSEFSIHSMPSPLSVVDNELNISDSVDPSDIDFSILDPNFLLDNELNFEDCNSPKT